MQKEMSTETYGKSVFRLALAELFASAKQWAGFTTKDANKARLRVDGKDTVVNNAGKSACFGYFAFMPTGEAEFTVHRLRFVPLAELIQDAKRKPRGRALHGAAVPGRQGQRGGHSARHGGTPDTPARVCPRACHGLRLMARHGGLAIPPFASSQTASLVHRRHSQTRREKVRWGLPTPWMVDR